MKISEKINLILRYINIMHWIKYGPSWIIAITACFGVATWKNKFLYERKISIVDSFYDAVSNFIHKIESSIEIIVIIKISIQSYEEKSDLLKQQLQQQGFSSGLHKFVETQGESHSIKLNNILRDCSSSMDHINKLITKVYTLKLKDNNSASNCYSQLQYSTKIIKTTAILLSMKTVSWKNPQVVDTMNQLKSIDVEKLKKSLEEAKRFIVEFHNKHSK